MGLVTGSHSVINKNPQLNVCIESTTLRLITGKKTEKPLILEEGRTFLKMSNFKETHPSFCFEK